MPREFPKGVIPNHGIEVDSQSIWCNMHRGVLRVDPKRRFDLASVRLFDFTVRDPRIQRECGFNPLTGAQADPAKLTPVLQAHSPLCCFVEPRYFERVLREAYPGLFEQAQRAMIRGEELAASMGRTH